MLETVDAVVDALGGTQKTAEWASVGPSAVSNWLSRKQIPSDKFWTITGALGAAGKTVAPAVFGFKDPRPRLRFRTVTHEPPEEHRIFRCHAGASMIALHPSISSCGPCITRNDAAGASSAPRLASLGGRLSTAAKPASSRLADLEAEAASLAAKIKAAKLARASRTPDGISTSER